MFIPKGFKSCVLEVRIPKGLRVGFSEVRIVKDLVASGGWLVARRSERKLAAPARSVNVLITDLSEYRRKSEKWWQRSGEEEVDGVVGEWNMGDDSKELDYCQGTVPGYLSFE